MYEYDIIIVTYNRLAYTRRTIESLGKANVLVGAQRIVIVDNNSDEPLMRDYLTALAAGEYHKQITTILKTWNGGWAQSVNEGLGITQAPYVLICNNDVEFDKGFLDKMFEVGKTIPNVGIVGPWRHTAHGLRAGGIQNDVFRELDNVPAVCWLMPRDVINKVGPLLERGPSLMKGGNGEDSDYVMRVRQAGYLIGCTATDVATHIDGY